jgi:hypothetical protein
MVMIHLRPLVLSAAFACVACDTGEAKSPPAPTKTAETPDPKQAPKEVEPPKPAPDPIEIAIASVTMVEDCQDTEAEAAKPSLDEAAEDMEMGAVAYDGGSFEQPCEQSTLQLSITGHEGDPIAVTIDAVRLLRPDTKATLADLKTRLPTAWNGKGAYERWDGQLSGRAELKASYKLSVPSWSDVDEQLDGDSSVGHMFVLEVDVTVGGKMRTVTSPEFTRREPEMIET